MKKTLCSLAILSLMSAAAVADDSGVHTSDGCGLGWQVMKTRTLLATTVRGTTNAFVPPTFGMTSGTMGCEKFSFAKNEENAVMYSLANQDALSIEMAQGNGEYLAGFAATLGCSDSAAFGKMTQENYSQIVGESATGVSIYQNVKKQIAQDPNLSSTCGV